MSTSSTNRLKIFYCYARKDQNLREELDHHLSNIKRLYHLEMWFDREINPGENWEDAIDEHLNSADLIFLLISPDFMASDYCYNKEMNRALIRHAKGEAKVIPILLRSVHWAGAPFSHIQLLPTDANPINRWPDRDDAFYNVVLGIEQVIKEFLESSKIRETQNVAISTRVSDTSVLFQLNLAKGGLAIAKEVDSDFIVLAGSQAKRDNTKSLRQTQLSIREQLRREQKLVEDKQNEFLSFMENIPFSSPSAAASIVTGAQANGHILWKVKATGQTYKEWKSQQAQSIDAIFKQI